MKHIVRVPLVSLARGVTASTASLTFDASNFFGEGHTTKVVRTCFVQLHQPKLLLLARGMRQSSPFPLSISQRERESHLGPGILFTARSAHACRSFVHSAVRPIGSPTLGRGLGFGVNCSSLSTSTGDMRTEAM